MSCCGQSPKPKVNAPLAGPGEVVGCCGRRPTALNAPPPIDPTPASADDGRSYPLRVWVICDGADDPWYLMGTDGNWMRAQVLSSQRGCGFDSSRSLLTEAPTVGTWVH